MEKMDDYTQGGNLKKLSGENKSDTPMKPFIKWAGGKSQLMTEIKHILPPKWNTYYEPFLGGGASLLTLAPKNAVVGDMNAQLVNAYVQIKYNPEQVIAFVNEFDKLVATRELYEEKRAEYNRKIANQVYDVEGAGLFIWINKHAFNGMHKVNKKGFLNTPFNYKSSVKSIDADNIRAISRYLNQNTVSLCSGDYRDTLTTVQKNDFVFLDPPYMQDEKKSGFVEYTKERFDFFDQLGVLGTMRSLTEKGVYVMTTNNDYPKIREMYSDFHIQSADVSRSCSRNGNTRKGKEVIITNYRPAGSEERNGIIIPETRHSFYEQLSLFN